MSAGYLANSWVVFALQHVRWEASKHPDIENVVVTDAAFNPAKQVSDIEDLFRQNIDLLIYWPVDDASIADVLKRAVDAGIPPSRPAAASPTRTGHHLQRLYQPVEAR